MALIKKDRLVSTNNESFQNYKIEPIYRNQTIDGLLEKHKENLEVASFLPHTLINTIIDRRENSDSKYLKIVIKVFINNKLFQQHTETHMKTNSRLISVSLPGESYFLPESLPIFLKKAYEFNSNENYCGYWEFHTSDRGGWLQNGCRLYREIKYDNTSLMVCKCEHLTHFGYLSGLGSNKKARTADEKLESNILRYITIICGSLSIIGIISMSLGNKIVKTIVDYFCRNIWNVLDCFNQQKVEREGRYKDYIAIKFCRWCPDYFNYSNKRCKRSE